MISTQIWKKAFEINDLGIMSYFLGLKIKQDALGIHVSQKKYVENILKSYNMLNCKSVSIPLSPSLKMQAYDEGEEIDGTAYRQLTGKLIYITHSRPDIAFLVSFLSRFMHRPTKIHLRAAKHLLIYLAGFIDSGIFYGRNNDCIIQRWLDSD